MSATALAAALPSSAPGWSPGLLAISFPIFCFGFGAYALSRKFGRSIAAATAAGVLAMFLVEYLTKGTFSGTGRAIVALTVLSALFSGLGASYARLLVRERERIGGKSTATASIAGLSLGLAAVAGLILGNDVVVAFSGLDAFARGPFFIALFCSILAVAGGGAFAIAMKTQSTGGTAGAVAVAMVASILFSDDTGYGLAAYMMTLLPITIVSAWLGARFGRRRKGQM
jgi:hypothetical protein